MIPRRPTSRWRQPVGRSNSHGQSLGAHYIGLGYEDQYLHDTDEARNRLTDIIRAAGCGPCLAPPPVDYASDHMTASAIAFSAVQFAGIKSIFTDHEPLDQYPWLYYMDAITGLESQPTHYIDISDVFERKCELCATTRAR